LWRLKTVAITDHGLQQVNVTGFIPKTSTRNGGGFFFARFATPCLQGEVGRE